MRTDEIYERVIAEDLRDVGVVPSPAGNEMRGEGTPPTKTTAPHIIASGLATYERPWRHASMSRADQLLASLGYGSRREVNAMIDDGRVTVAGQPCRDGGQKVRAAEVHVDSEPLDHPDGLLLLLHKPAGLVCSHDLREGPNVYSLLPARWQRRNPPVTSIGRLDKDTTGLLLLTDQSQLVHRLTSPKHKVSKEYQVALDRPCDPQWIDVFARGTLQLDGESKPCAPAELRTAAGNEAIVILTEGKYHQVRRMFAACGATVLRLHRARFGEVDLGSLVPGQWRELPLDTFA